MPSARIDDKGTTFYYTDSGAPPGVPDYTTIVLVHGLSVNSGIFERMLPYASKYELRIIAVNTRSHGGSTPYTDDELAEFASSDVEIQTSAVRKFGREVGSFMVFACTSLGIPAVTVLDGQKRGGLAFLTWSLSNMGLLSILGDPKTLDDAQKTVLQRYLRTAFAYDGPSMVYGQFPDLGIYSPLHSPAIREEDKPKAFMEWVSAYFTSISDIERVTPDALRDRRELKEHMPTLLTLSHDESARIIEPHVVHYFPAIGKVPLSVHERHARRTFLDAEAVLPEVKVVGLWCDRSTWEILWGTKVLDELVREEPEPRKRKREASLVRIADANHLYQWEDPEKMVRILRENL